MIPEEMLISFLSKHAGKLLNYWKPINRVADDLVGYDAKYSHVDWRVRCQKRIEVSKILNSLIRQGKVKRYRDRRLHVNKVRINEAFVQNRSLIR